MSELTTQRLTTATPGLLALLLVTAVSPVCAAPAPIALNGLWTTYSDVDSPAKSCAVQAQISGGKFTFWGATDRQNVLRLSLYKSNWQIPGVSVPIVLTFASGEIVRLTGWGHDSFIRADIPNDTVRLLVHHFTADDSLTMTLPEGREGPWTLDLHGTTPAIEAMARCVDNAQLLLPPPFRPPVPIASTDLGIQPQSPVVAPDSTTGAPDHALLGPTAPADNEARSVANSDDHSPPAENTQPNPPESAPTPAQDHQSITAEVPANSATSQSESGGDYSAVFIIGLLAAGGLAAILFYSSELNKKRTRVLKAILDEIEFNGNALRVKRIQTVQRDEFGTVQFGKWLDAKKYYVNTRINPIVFAGGYASWPEGLAGEVDFLIEQAAARLPTDGTVADEVFVSSPEFFDARMHPIDYEMYCALQLQKAGWDTRTTVATGDQGADIIAKQAGKTLVVQCKLYSSPIGNDAVQQAFAAKTFQSAQLAAVVSNQPFTRSAKQLASVSNVYLLHHDELSRFRPVQVRA